MDNDNKAASSQIDPITAKRIGRLLAKTVSRYLKDKEHRREFEEWYFKKYGVNYQWKTERNNNMQC